MFTKLNRMKKFCTSLLLIFSFSIYSPAQAFTDVPVAGIQYLSVLYLIDENVINGYNDGTFQPNKLINRAEALKIILSAAQIDVPETNVQKFVDVPNEAWFAKYVNHAVSLGVISENSINDKFYPARPVNRAEFAKMLIKTFGIDTAVFDLKNNLMDVPETAWYAPYLNFFVKFDILVPNLENKAFPEQNVSRGDAVEYIFLSLLKGKALIPQTLLNLCEKHLVATVELLETKQLSPAGLTVIMAEEYADLVLQIAPQNPTAKAAKKTTEAVKNLVGSFYAGENGRIEDALKSAQNSWELADEASRLNPGQYGMANSIKNLAHGLADKSRNMKNLAEVKK